MSNQFSISSSAQGVNEISCGVNFGDLVGVKIGLEGKNQNRFDILKQENLIYLDKLPTDHNTIHTNVFLNKISDTSVYYYFGILFY